MNRGIDKEVLKTPVKKGKTTKSNPIRVDVLVPQNTVARIIEVSDAMKIEKAATVRMLVWFGLRFASPFELSKIADEKMYRIDGISDVKLDIRVTQEMLDEIEKMMKVDKLSKSSATKTLIFWALSNIGNYTIQDFIKINQN